MKGKNFKKQTGQWHTHLIGQKMTEKDHRPTHWVTGTPGNSERRSSNDTSGNYATGCTPWRL